MNTQMIDIKKLEVNKGQIEGLPKNPRLIKDHRFEALKKSIQDAPEMLNLRELLVFPHEDKFVVIGGNMRLKACKELGFEELPCKVLPIETPVEKLREYTIKDNVGFGEDNWDDLKFEWNPTELTDWGLEFEKLNIIDDGEEDDFVDRGDVQFIVEVICKDETEQSETFSKLDAQGFEVRFKMK